MYFAIYSMLYFLCGEDDALVRDAKITEIAPDTFHVQSHLDIPMDELDLKVRITKLDNHTFHYEVFDSKYADDGEFDARYECLSPDEDEIPPVY